MFPCKKKSVERLHFITQDHPAKQQSRVVHEALRAGARCIQLREKERMIEDLVDDARMVKDLCSRYDATLIVNDYVEVAQAVQAQGVHLGKQDMHPRRARELLGDVIIGGTANTLRDAIELIEAGVDYVGIGPFRMTQTKKNLSPVLGIEGIRPIVELCNQEQIPAIIVGGVSHLDIAPILREGAHGVAVSHAIYAADSVHEEVTRLLHEIEVCDGAT